MLNLKIKKHILDFRFDAGTSRGILKQKETWFITMSHPETPEITGIGECGPLKGLSLDDVENFEHHLHKLTDQQLYLDLQHSVLQFFPSVRFAFETALADLKNGGKRIIFKNRFSESLESVPINGLIWMGDKQFIIKQLKEKIEAGFTCLKLKVGALDFNTELDILKYIRKEYLDDITIRLDANGAFSAETALPKLNQLAPFQIHSVEQPIRAGQVENMALLCSRSPVKIALDEELIGVTDKEGLLKTIKPHFIILKPTLLGGFSACDEWIEMADRYKAGWWITSALESNIGLNAISQYAFEKIKNLPEKPLQGLGTGTLYHNNIPSPLQINRGFLQYNPGQKWDISHCL